MKATERSTERTEAPASDPLPETVRSGGTPTRIYDGGNFSDFDKVEPPHFFEGEDDPPTESEGRVE